MYIELYILAIFGGMCINFGFLKVHEVGVCMCTCLLPRPLTTMYPHEMKLSYPIKRLQISNLFTWHLPLLLWMSMALIINCVVSTCLKRQRWCYISCLLYKRRHFNACIGGGWVYDSLLVLLDTVRLYRVYRRLDTLPLYLHYELLIERFGTDLNDLWLADST